MSKRKKKEMIMSEPSTQLSITEFMVEGEKPKEIVLKELPRIKLEPADKDKGKKSKLEFEEKDKDEN